MALVVRLRETLEQVARLIKAYLVHALTSSELISRVRAIADLAGLSSKHIVFYHCMSDPHSFIALQALGLMVRKYDVKVLIIVVPEPADAGLPAYATSREQQFAWRIRDARVLFNVYEDLITGVPSMESFPKPKTVHLAERWAAANLNNTFLDGGSATQNLLKRIVQVSSLLLANDASGLVDFCVNEGPGTLADENMTDALLKRNATRLRRAGHYLSGTAFYGFEWFWGIDRLHYLESILLSQERLRVPRRVSRRSSLSRRRDVSPSVYADLRISSSATLFSRTCNLLFRDKMRQAASFKATPDERRELPYIDFYYSFRSPYSQIALRPLLDMADFYGVQVRFRPVLPMLMSGLPVGLAKSFYIARDARREAERLEWTAYGFFNDPIGEPIHHAFALFMEARAQGKERDFLLAWSKHVWTRALDPHTHAGLRTICRTTGIRWDPSLLHTDTWKAFAAENRRDLHAHGLWGVPSFAFMDTATWGQDRLFLVEERIIRAVRDIRAASDTLN
ncbi:Hypothetical Protein FCC1311_063002 [Hondaea fermentalgiana]|uniref:DSBA-like thioredoxin domain-containing protein n=1 Tax=Hondaea fermentalgiana TaxID=2315210 RepID=A0A2R5GGT1_9STRA|nr:Hypothetical Protein FCC1311_063002 [Hondaea fermentalgiana]|eukprot:GBG30080.1 Hypothetical Protein FCC1311_063002 [Hondaea fermentalgiana]